MSKAWKVFATVDPFDGMNAASPGVAQNLVGGKWESGKEYRGDILDPLNGGTFVSVPDTTDIDAFIQGLDSCPKSGLHNPLKNTDRYVHLGRVCARSAALLATPEVEEYFHKIRPWDGGVIQGLHSCVQCDQDGCVWREGVGSGSGSRVRGGQWVIGMGRWVAGSTQYLFGY